MNGFDGRLLIKVDMPLKQINQSVFMGFVNLKFRLEVMRAADWACIYPQNTLIIYLLKNLFARKLSTQ